MKPKFFLFAALLFTAPFSSFAQQGRLVEVIRHLDPLHPARSFTLSIELDLEGNLGRLFIGKPNQDRASRIIDLATQAATFEVVLSNGLLDPSRAFRLQVERLSLEQGGILRLKGPGAEAAFWLVRTDGNWVLFPSGPNHLAGRNSTSWLYDLDRWRSVRFVDTIGAGESREEQILRVLIRF